jgi:WD40 repeat protein
MCLFKIKMLKLTVLHIIVLLIFKIIFQAWFGWESAVNAFNITSSGIFRVLTTVGHTQPVNGIARINENQIATTNNDGIFIVWDLNTGALINSYYGPMGQGRGLVVMPSGALAHGTTSAIVSFWDMQALTITNVQVAASITSMMFNPKQGPNGTLVVLTTASIKFLDGFSYNITSSQAVSGLHVEIDGPTGFVWICGGSYVSYFNLTNNAYSGQFSTSAGINTMKILPDNETIVLGRSNGTLQLFSMTALTFGATYNVQTQLIWSFEITPDRLYLTSTCWDNTIAVWSWITGSLTLVKNWPSPSTATIGLFINPTYTEGKLVFFCDFFLIESELGNQFDSRSVLT